MKCSGTKHYRNSKNQNQISSNHPFSNGAPPVLHSAMPPPQVTEWISGERLELTAARDLDEETGTGTVLDGWKGLALLEDIDSVGIKCNETGIKTERLVEFFGQCCQHLVHPVYVFLTSRASQVCLWIFCYSQIRIPDPFETIRGWNIQPSGI